MRFCGQVPTVVVGRSVDRVVPAYDADESSTKGSDYDEDEAVDEFEVAWIVAVVLAKEAVDAVDD
jgi:hypothetical protein